MKAVGYVRISDADQSHNSIEDQHIRITEYCTRNNISLEKIFTERGKSAFTFNRPEWKSLENYLRKNKDVQFLIVKHIDRFSRAELLDALIKIDEIENKLKVKIVSIEDPINQNSSDLGVQLMRTIKLLFSNNELNRIKERTNDGIYRSLSNGRFCNRAPIGYKNSNDHEGKPLLKIDEERAEVIRKIFKWYNEGKEIVEVKRLAIDAGLTRKGRSVIQEILDNPVYAGMIRVPAYKGKPEKIVKGLHAPIISEHSFYTAQQRLHQKGIKIQKREEVPLRGILHCHCGRKMTAGNSRGRNGTYYWYYLCETHKKNLSAKKLHAQLYAVLDELSIQEERIEWYKSKILESIEQKYANKGGAIMKAKLELQKAQQKINATQEKYLLQPDISPEVYAKVMTDLKVQETRWQEEIAKLNTNAQAYYKAIDDVLPKLNNVRESFLGWPLHQQQLFLNMVFRESLSYADGVYRTTFINPLFADKVLILKEKGLLVVEQSSLKTDVSPISAGNRTLIETLEKWAEVFAA
jgi:site-specific DNA recombinase